MGNDFRYPRIVRKRLVGLNYHTDCDPLAHHWSRLVPESDRDKRFMVMEVQEKGYLKGSLAQHATGLATFDMTNIKPTIESGINSGQDTRFLFSAPSLDIKILTVLECSLRSQAPRYE